MIHTQSRLRVILLTLAGAMLHGPAYLQGDFAYTKQPPGVVIDHMPAKDGRYVGSPSIVVLSDGRYVASHDIFRPGSTFSETCVFESTDRGLTWQQIAEIEAAFWSTLFVHRDVLDLMGTTRRYGDTVIRRSDDNGRTWTNPTEATKGLLLRGGGYHCAPQPVLVHQGRIWHAMEDNGGEEQGWSKHFRTFMLSAPPDADLPDATSWTVSNALARDPKWFDGQFNGWLEGNAVAAPDGGVVNLLRVDVPSGYGKAAIVDISDDGRTASFDPATGFIEMPGGSTKFTIRVSRTAYEDRLGGTHNFHDANFLTFHRVRDFRNVLNTELPPIPPPKGQPSLQTSGSVVAPEGRLNVLFIAVDDLRVELGCYGDTMVKSPSIDRLARHGMLFTRAYCQQSLCNPSRASVLTGLRPDTLGVWDLPTHFREKRPEVVSLPQWFKQHGYHTQNIGKMFHNYRQDDFKGDAVSWSVPARLHYGSHYIDDQVRVDGVPPQNFATLEKTECRDVPDEAYLDGRVAAEAVKVLGQIKDRPFFLAVGFWKPHLPFNAPKKYWDLYDRSTIELPPNPDPPVRVPPIALQDYRIDSKEQLTDDDVRELRHGHYAAISYLDTQVGKVLNELERLGLRDKTIVVFWSDHGLHLGEHGLWSKTTCFELDARVPLIIATPDHKDGQRSSALVELLDLYPTLADLCSLPAPANLEGVSLRPILDDPKAVVKSAAFSQHPRPPYSQRKDPQVMGYSIRVERYRYTEWLNFKTGRIVARELYDHSHDPRETVNLADREENAAIIRQLATQMDTSLNRVVPSPYSRSSP